METTVVTPTPEKYGQKKAVFRAYQVIWYFLGFVEAVLAFRFALKALGANSGSGFASLVYTVSAPFAAPFLGIFPASATGRVLIEWSTIVAMIVYLLLAYGLVSFLQFVKPTNPKEVEETIKSNV